MPSRKTSVLVVDDDVRVLRMVQRILEMEGYRVYRAINSEAALNILDEEIPDVVLLDIMMPDIDGYTMCRRIREFSPVPIIFKGSGFYTTDNRKEHGYPSDKGKVEKDDSDNKSEID